MADTPAQPGNHLKKRTPAPSPGGDGTAFASAFSGMASRTLSSWEHEKLSFLSLDSEWRCNSERKRGGREEAGLSKPLIWMMSTAIHRPGRPSVPAHLCFAFCSFRTCDKQVQKYRMGVGHGGAYLGRLAGSMSVITTLPQRDGGRGSQKPEGHLVCQTAEGKQKTHRSKQSDKC